MHTFNVTSGPISSGSQAAIYAEPRLVETLQDVYGREGLCLKAFYRPKFYKLAHERLEHFRWGGVSFLTDATVVQNLMAWYGISPRVYDIVRVGGQGLRREWCFAQVTDQVEGVEEFSLAKGKLRHEIMQRYGITDRTVDCRGEMRWHGQGLGGYYIDFQTHSFVNKEDYRARLVERLLRGGERTYQPLPELGIPGRRGGIVERSEAIDLDCIDFRGKTVLDVGCSFGAFSREAARRGAKRVVAVDRGVGNEDWDCAALQAYEVSNLLGFWNLDFLQLTLPCHRDRLVEMTGIAHFDILFLLAALQGVGWPKPWMAEMCREVCLVEGHLEKSEADWPVKYEYPLREIFNSVEFLGISERRPVYRCK